MNLEQLKALLEGYQAAKHEDEFLEPLRILRKKNPEHFVRSLVNAAKSPAFENERRAFINRWNLTPVEMTLLIIETVRNGDEAAIELIKQNLPEWVPLINDYLRSGGHDLGPTATFYLQLGISMLKHEQTKKTLEAQKVYVKKLVDDIFSHPPEPYSKQQVNDCAEWFIATAALNSEEKKIIDPRSRSRCNVKTSQWNARILAVFEEQSPYYAKDFKDDVRREVRKRKRSQVAES